MFGAVSLLVWGGIRADELRVLERETARELFGEWKEGRRRSRRGLWTAGASMMTERTGTKGRHLKCDQQGAQAGSHSKPARSMELKCDKKSVLAYYMAGGRWEWAKQPGENETLTPRFGIMPVREAALSAGTALGWGIRHGQEKTLVGLFQAPGPCEAAALRCLARPRLVRPVTREAAIGR